MFASIARRYDMNNRLHSLWRDQAWRRAAVRLTNPQPGDRVLDCACGTGDLTLAFARSPASRVVGIDFTPEMLVLARAKAARARQARVEFVEGDAQALPFADGSFTIVSIAFGIRNVQDPTRAFDEFLRVLAPRGRLVVLEFDRPNNPVVRSLNNLYSGRIMPLTATLLSGDRSGAYRYLPRSVGTFLDRRALGELLASRGFERVSSTPLTLGICACTLACKPGA